MKYFVLTFLLFLLFVSCQKTDSQDAQEEQLENIVVRNYNDTGLDVTISPFSTTRTSESEMKEETFLITIENPDSDNDESILESLLVIEHLSDTKTLATHTTVDGEIFAVFTCEKGEVVDINVSDDNSVETRGLGSWFRCVKQQYTTMFNLIHSDKDLSLITTAIRAIRPGMIESEVAVSAAIWCAK